MMTIEEVAKTNLSMQEYYESLLDEIEDIIQDARWSPGYSSPENFRSGLLESIREKRQK